MNEESETKRRADKRQDEIEKLISAENDPKQRALMIVLQSINQSLIANTICTQGIQSDVTQHRKDFVTHAMNEEALINKGKGAWWVMATVLTILQGVVIYGWNASRNEIETMKSQAVEAQLIHQKLVGRITHLEQTK